MTPPAPSARTAAVSGRLQAGQRRMRSLAIAGAVLAAAAIIALFLATRPRPAAGETVAVRRGDLAWRLHQAGTLQPRTPHLVATPYGGRLQWMVEDGAWVEAGDPLFRMSDEDEVKRLAEERGKLIAARQELALARIRRDNAAAGGRDKTERARRQAALDELRHRILTSPPRGGDALVRLDAELAPLEAANARLRSDLAGAETAWRTSQESLLALLDRWQQLRGDLLRTQARIDEAGPAAAPDPGENAAQRSERAQRAARAAEAATLLARLQAEAPALSASMAAARESAEAARRPRDELAARLAPAEARERELWVAIEIEKRGLERERLRLDAEAQGLAAGESARRLALGRTAHADGALSGAQLEELSAAAEVAEAQLAAVQARLRLAERGPAPEQVAESEARLRRSRGQAEAAAAEAVRADAIAEQDLAVLQARVARLAAGIADRANRFPALIEAQIQFGERELALLDPEETQRRSELASDLARLRAVLEQARRDPPDTVRAPVAGVAVPRRVDNRPRQAGDRVWEDDVLVELLVPGDMEVRVAVNESAIAGVARGQRAMVTVPALAGERFPAEVERVAAAGRDKPSAQGWSGVTQFAIALRLERTSPGFRPGMTALVAIEAAQRGGVLWLPRAAVLLQPGSASVLVGEPGSVRRIQIDGEPFGDDAFVVAKGLAEGDRVWIPAGEAER